MQVLRHEEIKQENNRWFSRQSLVSFVKSREEIEEAFNRQLLKWISQLTSGEPPLSDTLEQQVVSILRPLLGNRGLSLSRPFLSAVSSGINSASQETQTPSNIYYHQATIPIEVETIHGVKGQTHEATLLLETYWRDYHLHKLLPYLKGERESKIATRNQRRLNLA